MDINASIMVISTKVTAFAFAYKDGGTPKERLT
jgi:hypothetical protein